MITPPDLTDPNQADRPVILYVEDDTLNRDLLKIFLIEVLGFDAPGQGVVFENSTNFMARLSAIQPKPSLILLDIQMMPMSGIAMINLLRNDPDYRTTPVAAVTASVMDEEIKRIQQAGFNGCISKPLDPNVLGDAITRLLKGESVWIIR